MSVPRISQLAGEEGAVMVTVALALPVLILFASFAVDVGNWFEHQRHLQLQADAGALAAAGDFRYPCNAADDENVEKRAREYSGTETETSGYNHQVGGTPFGAVHFALNSSTYPEQPSKVDPTVVAKPPCEAGMIDVKLAETDLPLFFRVAGLLTNVPFINAHARVQVFEKENVSGALPVAVPDSNPQKVRVTFFDEENEDKELESRELRYKETSEGLAIWANEEEPLPLTVKSGRIGVRVALSGVESTSCGDPLVQCYPTGGGGLLFARGYSMEGSGAQPGAPLARDAYLEKESCTDPYFSAGGCSVVLHANVDFGPCEEIEKVGPKLTAVTRSGSYAMTGGPCTGTSTSEWTSEPIPVPTEAGSVPVELKWAETKGEEGGNECNSKGGNKCTGGFGVVQRSFAANEGLSGPIRLAQLEEVGHESGSELWANSFERCSSVQESCTHDLVVRIGIDQSLGEMRENASSVEEEPVELRVTDASQNQSLDCEPHEANTSNLQKELALGCTPVYTRNKGTDCPAQSSALWASPEPWECVAIQTGVEKNQVYFGMNERVFGEKTPATCLSPNEWSKFPELDPGDPRIVPVFLTAFGSFNGSGNETVPVTGFGTFYVTGWRGSKGNASRSICSGTSGEEPDDSTPEGTIVGHFFKYVDALNEGGASEKKCEFNSPTPCVAVLTE
jgi:hypothetical protein